MNTIKCALMVSVFAVGILLIGGPAPSQNKKSGSEVPETDELREFVVRFCQEGEAVPETTADFFHISWPGSSDKRDTRQLAIGWRGVIMPLENCPENGKTVYSPGGSINLIFFHKYKSFSDIFATNQKGVLLVYVKWPVSGPSPTQADNPTQAVLERFQKEKSFWLSRYPPRSQ